MLANTTRYNKDQFISLLQWVKKEKINHPLMDCNVLTIILECMSDSLTLMTAVARNDAALFNLILDIELKPGSNTDLKAGGTLDITREFNLGCKLGYFSVLHVFRIRDLDISECLHLPSMIYCTLTTKVLTKDAVLFRWILEKIPYLRARGRW